MTDKTIPGIAFRTLETGEIVIDSVETLIKFRDAVRDETRATPTTETKESI